MNLVFESSAHDNGGCILSDPSQVIIQDLNYIFDVAAHSNGGCIFDNEFTESTDQGGGDMYRTITEKRRKQQADEDDVIFAVVAAFMEMIV